jgi:hypothetical protein
VQWDQKTAARLLLHHRDLILGRDMRPRHAHYIRTVLAGFKKSSKAKRCLVLSGHFLR